MTIRSYPRTRKATTVVQFVPTCKSAQLIHDVRNVWPKRIKESRILFLLDVAKSMLDDLQKRAPDVEFDSEELDYAKDLRIGLLEEGDGQDTIAIYLEGATAEVTANGARQTVLYFRQKGDSPKWVEVLMKHGPWPAEMVPVVVTDKDAKIISRRARPDELSVLSSRLYAKSRDIETELKNAKAPGEPHVGKTMHGVGLTVHKDLGYDVARKELGLDGAKKDMHWRPAFRATKEYAALCMEKVIEYIKTGDKNVFDLPTKTDSIGKSVIEEGKGFSKAIAPFLK